MIQHEYTSYTVLDTVPCSRYVACSEHEDTRVRAVILIEIVEPWLNATTSTTRCGSVLPICNFQERKVGRIEKRWREVGSSTLRSPSALSRTFDPKRINPCHDLAWGSVSDKPGSLSTRDKPAVLPKGSSMAQGEYLKLVRDSNIGKCA